MSQAHPGKGTVLDMATIYEQLHQALPARGLPRPQQNNRNLGGRIAFIVNPAHQTTTHTDPAPTQSPNQPGRRNAPRKAPEAPGGKPQQKNEDEIMTASGLVIPDSAREHPRTRDDS